MKNLFILCMILFLAVMAGVIWIGCENITPSNDVIIDTIPAWGVDSAIIAKVNLLSVDAEVSKNEILKLKNALTESEKKQGEKLANLKSELEGKIAELKQAYETKPDVYYVDRFLGDGNLYFKNNELMYDTLHLLMGKDYEFIIYEDTADMIVKITMLKK